MEQVKKYPAEWSEKLGIKIFHGTERISGSTIPMNEKRMSASEFIDSLSGYSFDYDNRQEFIKRLTEFGEKYDIGPECISRALK